MFDLTIARKMAGFFNRYIGKRQAMQEKAKSRKWNSLFKSQEQFVGPLGENLQLYFYKDSVLSKYIYEGFEEDEIKFLKNYLQPGDLFLDIGSNIGLFSLHAARQVGTTGGVISFEPTPKTFERLKENINLNQFDSIVSPVNKGLSDNNGVLMLNLSSNGQDAWNTFASSAEGTHDKQTEVPVMTLDHFLVESKTASDRIVLIKIDVEGWEVPVVKGAMKFLGQKDSPTMMVEFTESNAFAAGCSCWELYDLVVSLGYSWYIYDAINNSLIPDKKRLHYPYLNLIAVKNIEMAQKRLADKIG